MATNLTRKAIPTVNLPSGEAIPVLGQGTWGMGEERRLRGEEILALQLGIDLGMTLIDTAEMYGEGAGEELVGEAIRGRRKEVFLVSKVLPDNATTHGTVEACERSLRRLKTDYLDMYLLHWRGPIPLENTVEAFGRLVRAGKIRYWGVSNFDVADMEELMDISGGSRCQTDQVLYNLTRRGIEYDLIPWCIERDMPIMAYSPIEQGRLLNNSTVRRVAMRHHATPAQVSLAWVLRVEDVNTIPKASTREHVHENHAALNVTLSEEDLAELDAAFPPPTHKAPLEVI
jgi:diketogulonate reductase-like aldo/keto reductase